MIYVLSICFRRIIQYMFSIEFPLCALFFSSSLFDNCVQRLESLEDSLVKSDVKTVSMDVVSEYIHTNTGAVFLSVNNGGLTLSFC